MQAFSIDKEINEVIESKRWDYKVNRSKFVNTILKFVLNNSMLLNKIFKIIPNESEEEIQEPAKLSSKKFVEPKEESIFDL